MNELSGGRVEAVDIGGSLETRVHLSDEAAILIANQPLLDEMANIVSALEKARSHEERKQTGSALAWFLKARTQYPQSELAAEGISRIVKGLHRDAAVE